MTGTFGDHLEALRPHLLRSAAAFALLFAAAFVCKKLLVDTILLGPLDDNFPTNRLIASLAERLGFDSTAAPGSTLTLVNTSMAGQFNLHLKISFLAALVGAFPYTVWEVWRFVKPALTQHELDACRHLTLGISLCFLTGVAFGYFVTAPVTVGFLSRYDVSPAVVNMIDANSYLATVVNVTLACGVLFQLPLLVRFLARAGIVTADMLRRYRRHALLLLTLLSAIITPPDVVSTIIIVMPLYALYEFGIQIAERQKAKFSAKVSS